MKNKIMKAKFYYGKLNNNDYKQLKQYAEDILKQKNIISETVFNDKQLLEDIFYGLPVTTFTTKMKNYRIIDGVAFQQCCRQVFTMYQIICSSIKYTNEGKYEKYLVKLHYKTKNDIAIMLEATDTDFAKECLKNFTDEMFNEVHQYQIDYIHNISKVVFKSLTFSSINVLTYNIDMFQLEHSKDYNCKFILNIPNKSRITLKTSFNKKYHNPFTDIQYSYRYIYKDKKPTNKITQRLLRYTIKFLDNKKIKLIIYEDNKEVKNKKEKMNKNNILGVDVNVKHNIFACNDGKIITVEEQLLTKERRLKYYINKLNHNKDMNHNTKKHGKKVKLREHKQERRRIWHQNLKSNELVKYCLKKNYKYIAMEDLNQQLKGYDDKEKNMNSEDYKSAIHFNDLKNSVKRIANKNGIHLDLVFPAYTSRTCPICGHIHKDNRKDDEFKCLQCGYTANADINAALNIRNRILITDLKNQLEYYDRNSKMYKGRHRLDIGFYQNIYTTYQKSLII